MSFEQISYLSQTIAAMAVVVSLIYAALQFRIYTKASHEARLVASSSDIQETRRMVASDPDCARVFVDGLADFQTLDKIDKMRFDSMMQLIVTQVIYLTRFKDIPAEFNANAIFGHPGVKQWWASRRSSYAPHVVSLMDGVMAIAEAR